jgi:hypothetical protein
MEVRTLQRFGIGRQMSMMGYPIVFKNPTEVFVRDGRPTAYRLCVRTHHQPDYSVDPVCALAAESDRKSADLKVSSVQGAINLPYRSDDR